jgi:acetylornithine deacetylase/succinyl-diaminopimelate desuccinylase-like protein
VKNNFRESIAEYTDRHRDEAIALLKTLGAIPAPSHHEDLRAEFVLSWLKNQGADHVYIDRAKNVVCEIGTAEHEQVVVFMAHTDTVFPDTEPLEVVEKDGKLFAPGIGDDTANLVNLLMGTKYLLEKKPKLSFGYVIAANSCEEGLGNLEGCREIFRVFGRRVRYFYSFDRYIPECVNEAVGSCRYRIEVKTQGGHSWTDFGNPNAILVLNRILSDLAAIEFPGEGKTTCNVGRIEGGTSVNTIAENASALYEFRSDRQENLDYMKEEVQKVFEKYQGDPSVQVHPEVIGVRPGTGAVNAEEMAAFTNASREIIESYYDGKAVILPISTDANIPLSLGITANTLGAVRGGGAHTRGEWIELDSLAEGGKIVLACLMRFAGEECE